MTFRNKSLLIVFASFLLLNFITVSYAETSLSKQRTAYVRALKALANGDTKTFRILKRELDTYPLYPYLLYADYSVNISKTNPTKLHDFLNQYSESVLSSKLRTRWLKRLSKTGDLSMFTRIYPPSVGSIKLECHYQLARYRLGNKKDAIEQAIKLWQVGKSQPKECDPLFKLLISGNHITEAVAWVRYTQAVLNHKYPLAHYIERFFSTNHYQQRAQNFIALDKNITAPKLDNQPPIRPEVLAVIAHGIQHLAKRDAPRALRYWNQYQQIHSFDNNYQKSVSTTLIKALYQQGHHQASNRIFEDSHTKKSVALLDWRLQESIKKSDWETIIVWSDKLQTLKPLSKRWQYWRARALQLSHSNTAPEVATLLKNLSKTRSFYGFLASEALGEPYSFEYQPLTINKATVDILASRPAFQRIKELRHHGDMLAARQEWYFALKGTNKDAWLVAATLARRWKWNHQTIMSMIKAGYWNDIELRFPMPYRDDFIAQTKITGVPTNLLLALSRQESAFSPTVTSPAGAKGLMQLMPGTAFQTAKKYHISYDGTQDLMIPAKNIQLGSRYYSEMLKRFNNNRILATAAYNAGPGRVNRWLKTSNGSLPYDAWIETIPFKETRNYVQNVLAFSIIYAHLSDTPTTMLSHTERKNLL